MFSPKNNMMVLPRAAASDPSSGSSTNDVLSGDNGEMFMNLLLAQLQAQDPLAPMDTNQMVSQLTQFDELSEVTQIRELLQGMTSSTQVGG